MRKYWDVVCGIWDSIKSLASDARNGIIAIIQWAWEKVLLAFGRYKDLWGALDFFNRTGYRLDVISASRHRAFRNWAVVSKGGVKFVE